MTTAEYEDHVRRHSGNFVDLNYAIVALNGEAGEVAEWHKKRNLRSPQTEEWYKTYNLTDADLKKELGDVQWYLTAIALAKGWTLDDIMETNVGKLDERVAAKFTQVV